MLRRPHEGVARTRCWVAATLGAALIGTACRTAVPPAPSLKLEARLPAEWKWEDQGFSVTARRFWTSGTERSLIERAEGLVPDSIESAIRRDMETRQHLSDVQRHEAYVRLDTLGSAREEPRWWYGQFDDTLLPFAVTEAGIRYYTAQMQQLSRSYGGRTWQLTMGDSVVMRGKTGGRFEYTARVEPVSSGPDANRIRVELRIEFDLQCGMACGLGFTKSRSVYFSQDGEVVRVEGDGPPLYAVS